MDRDRAAASSWCMPTRPTRVRVNRRGSVSLCPRRSATPSSATGPSGVLRHVMAARIDRLPAGTDLVVRANPPAAGAASPRSRCRRRPVDDDRAEPAPPAGDPAMTRRPSLRTLLALPAIWLIRAYQLVLSPMTPRAAGSTPRAPPTPSPRSSGSGCCKGSWLAGRRLLRCHPWNPGRRGPRSAGGTFASAAVEDPAGTLPLDLNRHRPPYRRPEPHLVSDHSPDP